MNTGRFESGIKGVEKIQGITFQQLSKGTGHLFRNSKCVITIVKFLTETILQKQ